MKNVIIILSFLISYWVTYWSFTPIKETSWLYKCEYKIDWKKSDWIIYDTNWIWVNCNTDTDENVDIDFALLPDYERLGYGFEMAKATILHSRNVLQLKSIVAITDVNNTSSITLLNKLGLHYEKKVNSAEGDEVLLFSWRIIKMNLG